MLVLCMQASAEKTLGASDVAYTGEKNVTNRQRGKSALSAPLMMSEISPPGVRTMIPILLRSEENSKIPITS